MQGDRVIRRGKLSGQAQVEVIFWLQKLERFGVDVRTLVFDEQDVGNGIFAARGRYSGS